MSVRSAREASFYCYLKRFKEQQDIIAVGESCRSLYIIMEGVVGIYIKLKNGEELFTDYLGVGSIIGQYSMIE